VGRRVVVGRSAEGGERRPHGGQLRIWRESRRQDGGDAGDDRPLRPPDVGVLLIVDDERPEEIGGEARSIG
jgi:hypothetical protein